VWLVFFFLSSCFESPAEDEVRLVFRFAGGSAARFGTRRSCKPGDSAGRACLCTWAAVFVIEVLVRDMHTLNPRVRSLTRKSSSTATDIPEVAPR
jgi:hypothetical protein